MRRVANAWLEASFVPFPASEIVTAATLRSALTNSKTGPAICRVARAERDIFPIALSTAGAVTSAAFTTTSADNGAPGNAFWI